MCRPILKDKEKHVCKKSEIKQRKTEFLKREIQYAHTEGGNQGKARANAKGTCRNTENRHVSIKMY